MAAKTLKERLQDWTDWEGASRSLAICLGLMPDIGDTLTPDSPDWDVIRRTKHVFWSNNPIGTMLYDVLENLVKQGVLEKRDEPDIEFRWNPAFRGSWEKEGDGKVG